MLSRKDLGSEAVDEYANLPSWLHASLAKSQQKFDNLPLAIQSRTKKTLETEERATERLKR